MKLRTRHLIDLTSAIAFVMCGTAIVLWVWSQWTFARVTCSYVKDMSDPFKQRRLVFLMWRDAAELIVRNDVYHPDDENAQARLRTDLPREPHIDIYSQSGISTSEDGDEDVTRHWGFWYRSPETTQRKFGVTSKTRAVGGAIYNFTEEDESAFFLPWWFFVVLFGTLPAIVISRRLRRSLRRWGGRCVACGYDIRFATERCPECGTPIATNVAPTAR